MPQQYKRDQGGKFSHQNLLTDARQMRHRFATDTSTTEDKVKVGAAAVGSVAAFKGGSYGRGAYKLAKLSPQKAASMSHALNRSTTKRPSIQHLQTNPGMALKLGGMQRQSVKRLKDHTNTYGDVKQAAKGADYWADTFGGMKHSRKANAGKFGPSDILNFNRRPQAKYLNRIVENSGPSQTNLQRGIRHPTKLKVGDELNLDQSSWTDNPKVAEMYTAGRPTTMREAFRQAKGESPKGIPHTLVLPKGERATNVQGLTRTLQNEHLTPKGTYRVKGHTKDGHPVMERVKKNVSAFGVVHSWAA